MSFIGSFAQGDWGKGLAQMFGGSLGGNILETARGNMSGGQLAAKTGTDAATVAVNFIPGIGPVASAALQGAVQAGGTMAQGGTVKEAAIAGIGTAAGGAAGSLLGKAGTAIKEGVSKATSKISTTVKGAPTGAAANATNTQMAPVPSSAPTLRPKADVSSKVTGMAGLKAKANTFKAKAGKAAGQVGVQGALSIASAVAGAKQANAANEVSRQSLLFQKQTYNEQQAEVEKNKAKLKQDAWSDYSSASLFGEQLYGSESNSTLLTSYHTNGTGNVGNYSLIGSGITTSKLTDLT